MLGRLNSDAFPSDPITIGGALAIVLGALLVVAVVTYFKKWRWLWTNYLTSLDAKKIGIMYIVVSMVMLVRGFGDAILMRIQQAVGTGNTKGPLTADHFQQILTAHGTMMIFFVAMGLMFGLINITLPLMIGARDVAFPFLNSLSFWLFFWGVVLTNVSLVIGDFNATGWLAYPPLSELQYSPGVGVDYWIWAIQIAGVGSLLSGVNFIMTIIKMRAPGMTLMKMPVFVWSVLGSMLLIIFTFPILTGTLALLSMDRLFGMHIFTSSLGGSQMMYVNLIWAWGHPEVYILVLVAFGVFSEVVATFSRKAIFGYKTMVVAIMAISFFSYIVWLHHFFTMGAGADVNTFFGIATMVIAIPTGVKLFNWIFTMYKGRVSFTTPMVWFMGFVVAFTIGGATGVLHAIPSIDFQFHNSLFLVAHFHNMVIGGVVFGYMSGLVYWFPKVFGFRLVEGLGKVAAWCWIIGFFAAFVPLYILGLMGATRRLEHYPKELGWQALFIVAFLGVLLIGLGVVFQILQLVYSIWKRDELRDVTGDPWDARTLEWSTSSPAPYYNFAVLPTVADQDDFWHAKQRGDKKEQKFVPFHLPKDTPSGLLIASAAGIACFAVVWHIWWVVVIGALAMVVAVLWRLSGEEPDYEYEVTEEMVRADESERAARMAKFQQGSALEGAAS